jgi:hypothetical protein
MPTWDLPALFTIREEGVLRIFIALKSPSPWLGFEPESLGSSGQHTNHYTTKAQSGIQTPQILQRKEVETYIHIHTVPNIYTNINIT